MGSRATGSSQRHRSSSGHRAEVKPPSATRLVATADEAVSAQLPEDLRERLSDYLERASRALERDEKERTRRADGAAIQKRIVGLSTWLALLLGYSAVVGYLSSATLLSSLVDPAAIGRRIGALNDVSRSYKAVLPDEVRSIILTLVSASTVIALRVASLRARSALGGALFIGIATLALLGLAAAFTTGTGGALVAVPGFFAVFFVVYEFLRFLGDTVGASGAVLKDANSPPILRETMRRLHTTRQALLPGANRRRIALFVSVPVVAVVFVWAAASTNSYAGFLYWASRTSQIAFVIWCAWACVATPLAIRIPLWSLPVWGAIILTLFTYGPVAVMFAAAVLIVLSANVLIAALREPMSVI